MSLCWFIHEHLPTPGNQEEFYKLFYEASNLCLGWGVSDEEKAQLDVIEKRLAEISVEAPIPKKWQRGDSFMGKALSSCETVLGYSSWVDEAVYRDQTPSSAKEFANDLREEVRGWKEDHRGWSTGRDSRYVKDELNTIQCAIRFLERWAARGYCIKASY